MGPEPDTDTQRIIGCAMKVHRVLGPGFLEVVYQNALAHELSKSGFSVECHRRIKVMYDGIHVGDYVADMLVGGGVIIENKAVEKLATIHEVQLVHYLTATGLDVGLLINFGSPRLQFKRKTRLYQRMRSPVSPIVLMF